MLHHPCVPSKNSSFKQHESQYSGSLQASLQSGGMQRSHQRLATETPSRCQGSRMKNQSWKAVTNNVGDR
jgi:hypothetical protein